MSDELATLNSHHQRRLRATFQYIDNLLSEIDAMVNPRDSGALFPHYAVDFAPSQHVLLQSGIAQIRGRLVQAMKDNKVAAAPPSISAVQAIRSALNFIDIAVAELRPRYMRGYGARGLDLVDPRRQPHRAAGGGARARRSSHAHRGAGSGDGAAAADDPQGHHGRAARPGV